MILTLFILLLILTLIIVLLIVNVAILWHYNEAQLMLNVHLLHILCSLYPWLVPHLYKINGMQINEMKWEPEVGGGGISALHLRMQ
jgi:hypothetical protein